MSHVGTLGKSQTDRQCSKNCDKFRSKGWHKTAEIRDERLETRTRAACKSTFFRTRTWTRRPRTWIQWTYKAPSRDGTYTMIGLHIYHVCALVRNPKWAFINLVLYGTFRSKPISSNGMFIRLRSTGKSRQVATRALRSVRKEAATAIQLVRSRCMIRGPATATRRM